MGLNVNRAKGEGDSLSIRAASGGMEQNVNKR